MSELRRDPITGRTVIIAPERLAATRFQWALSGGDASNPAGPGEHPPAGPGLSPGNDTPASEHTRCPFCEGNEHLAGREILAWRSSGQSFNGPGWRVRVVPNRLPALRVESHYAEPSAALFETLGGLGAHEVIIESPHHHADWSTMTADDIRLVLWAWRERMRDLRRDVRLKTFLVVKNVGTGAGATLAHPHSQLLALPFVPLHLDDELTAAREHRRWAQRCPFCKVVDEELAADIRVIASDRDTVAISAFASRVPFETWVLPRRHLAAFDDECDDCLQAIAERVRDTMTRLHVVLNGAPHSVLLHTAPVGEATASYHWHLEIIPRLTPESGLAWDGGIHVNPVAPEEATRVLREALP
jgi:UDPglucose--hexose-1-phosphate uridylyltransferase